MIDILLMVVIGGMGTIYGAIIGATIVILARNYLQSLKGIASRAAADAGLPLVPGLVHPDRWLLWLGLLLPASISSRPEWWDGCGASAPGRSDEGDAPN